MMIFDVFVIVAGVLAVIEIIRTRGEELVAWALLLLVLGLKWPLR